jgi:hypothetical protein
MAGCVGKAGGEAFRVCGVGRGEHENPLGHALFGQAVMHIGGRSVRLGPSDSSPATTEAGAHHSTDSHDFVNSNRSRLLSRGPKAPDGRLGYHRAAMLCRRRFLQSVSSSLLASPLVPVPLVAEAQPTGKIRRIGVMHQIPPAASFEAFIVPIVFCSVGEDPVRRGWISSLARPGGNATGTVTLAVDLEAKRLELLKEAVPGLELAAVLWNPERPVHQSALLDVEAAGGRLGVRVVPVQWKAPTEIEQAFQLARRERAGAVLALTSPEIWRAREQIARFALKHRLPTAGTETGFAEAGNLMQYGPDRAESCRRAASHVDRILRGAKPGDLPIEQATKFELVMNLRIAKALGLTIPPSVILRADQLIE